MYAVHRIANTRRYRGRISYLEAADGEGKQSCDDTDEFPSSLSDPPPESWKTEEDEFICVYVLNLPYVDSSTLLAPDCLARDGLLWLLIVRKVVIDR